MTSQAVLMPILSEYTILQKFGGTVMIKVEEVEEGYLYESNRDGNRIYAAVTHAKSEFEPRMMMSLNDLSEGFLSCWVTVKQGDFVLFDCETVRRGIRKFVPHVVGK